MYITRNYNAKAEAGKMRAKAELIRNADPATLESLAAQAEYEAREIEQNEDLISQVWAQWESVETAYNSDINRTNESELERLTDFEEAETALKNYGFTESGRVSKTESADGKTSVIFTNDNGSRINVTLDSDGDVYEVDDEDGKLDFEFIDWLNSECLEIEHQTDGNGEYKGAVITLCCGGPGVWLDTSECKIYGSWGFGKVESNVDSDICEWLDGYLCELCGCR
ncbi:MAG: hypothetical protein LBR54_03245 [Oscillospiraceae bacterium]|jgi:hypothetical protein|nr:hypothetical protein [Oscillospiraceae bacterium]